MFSSTPSGFHDTAVTRDIAEQNGQTAVLAEKACSLERITPPSRSISSSLYRFDWLNACVVRTPPGAALKRSCAFGVVGHLDVPVGNRLAHGRASAPCWQSVVQQGPHGSARPGSRRCHRRGGRPPYARTFSVLGATLHRLRHLAAQAVHMAVMVKCHLALMRDGQQVQNGVGGAAHGDIQAHGVFEGVERARSRAAGSLFRPDS